ncbi:putative cross-wall-targeting lipoprotein signal domain-containing protein [Streptococcus dentasini]
MQKDTFSKRKTKFAGLCGAILATATIAVGVGTTVQADEATTATDTAAQQTTATDASKEEKIAVETEPVSTTAANTAAAPAADTVAAVLPESSAPVETVTTTAPAANTVADASATAANTAQATPQAEQQAAAPANSTSQPQSVNSVATKPENTEEYGTVDFDQTLTATAKTAPVTDVNYDGTANEYIEVADPNQPYTPNADNIAKYLNEYLTQLRQLNGINVPVPEANDLMKAYAQARADEEASETDGIDHDTNLGFPDGVTAYSENGHQDGLASIAQKNDAGQNLGSDKATAYYLALSWFSDYFNIASGDGMESFGHAISILSNSGEGMALGLSNAGEDAFYAMLEIGSNGEIRNEDGFTTTTDANGNYVLNYNGQQVKFLPKTTFHYVTKDPSAVAQTSDPSDDANTGNDSANTGQNNPANGNDPVGAGNGAAAGNNGNRNNNTQAAAPTAAGTRPVTIDAAQTDGKGSASVQDKQNNNLPNTGESAQAALTAVGAVLALAGLGLTTKRKLGTED